MIEYITDYESKIGKIQIAATEEAVTGLWFYGQKYFASTLEQEYEKKDILIFDEAKEWLDRYFSGENPQVTFPVAPKGSDFRQSVWRILREIPYGETMTYGEIAKKLPESEGSPACPRRRWEVPWGTIPFPLSFPATESSEQVAA